MSIASIVIVAIVVTIFATITLASVSYGVFRLRERRSPRLGDPELDAPQFFERVRFAAPEPDRAPLG